MSPFSASMAEADVVIVGAGPAGIAVSACLNCLGISNLVLEREDCYASLWKKRAYDRLKLHLAKEFCELPHMTYPKGTPTFVPKDDFVSYLDSYVSEFGVAPRYHRNVESASYDDVTGTWCFTVRNKALDVSEAYVSKFLVVATGENSEGVIPNLPGLDSFEGTCMHSNSYGNGRDFKDKDVLVVGAGNSGMEIAYDLHNWGASPSIVIRGPVHVVSKEIIHVAMRLLKIVPIKFVDQIILWYCKLVYGDLSKYGLKRPNEGVFHLKVTKGRSPIIDVGTIGKILNKQIKILPPLERIKGKEIIFEDGKSKEFDAIIFATGYRSTVRNWLQGGDDLFNENGMPLTRFPALWKGNCGIYCAGFSGMGLAGVSRDAQNIANDIKLLLNQPPN